MHRESIEAMDDLLKKIKKQQERARTANIKVHKCAIDSGELLTW
jgi:hypothetical protein